MEFSWPGGVRPLSVTPTLEGLQHQPFTNVDGETFGQPKLNGYWRIEMEVVALTRKAALALSGFITGMSQPSATCVIPVCVMGRPTDDAGREIAGGYPAPEYGADHTGWGSEPFDGVTLRQAASHRDSYIDVNRPALNHIYPGHFVSLGDRLHQVIRASNVNENHRPVRLHVMPVLRGDHAQNDVVIIDQLRLRCRLQDAPQIGFGVQKIKRTSLSFVEAF